MNILMRINEIKNYTNSETLFSSSAKLHLILILNIPLGTKHKGVSKVFLRHPLNYSSLRRSL